MKLVPRVLLLIIAALGMTGCRTYGTAPSPRLLPPPEPKTNFDVQEFVSEHNRNANLVKSLTARPKITASAGKQLRGTHLTGTLILERPRNFKLELLSDRGLSKPSVADIGSNDDEFWFWVKNDNDKSIYVCNHADLPTTQMAVSFQPDWIVDALGLKPISSQEARDIKVKPGADSKSVELVFAPNRANGQSFTRIMTVNKADNRVQKHRLYAADRKTLLAEADVSKYQPIELDPSASSTETSIETKAVCYVPEQLILDWKQDQFKLDVTLKEPSLNDFDPEQRSAVFVEPKKPGYARVDLATSRGPGNIGGETTTRESIPRPDSETRATGGIRLGAPISESDDAASLDRSNSDSDGVAITRNSSRGKASRSSMSGPDTSSVAIETPLRAAVPRAPEGFDYQTADSRAGNSPPAALSVGR